MTERKCLTEADMDAIVAEAKAALAIARATFKRYSFDLIYARPDQSLEAWEAELRRAIGFAADHLSLYQLTIEPDTAFEKLHAAGIKRVVLAAGSRDQSHDALASDTKRLQSEGMDARFVDLGNIGHTYATEDNALLHDAIVWADSAEELRERYGADVEPKSLTFIAAKLEDNKVSLDNLRENLAEATSGFKLLWGVISGGPDDGGALDKFNKEIATKMVLAESTVKNRLSVLFQKINVADRTQAAIYAITHGLAPIDMTSQSGAPG